ncbi:MAG TPA: chromosome segregation protein SMC [Candidatus Marinimicrobia bacterium]|nr:chromosome segregation protein SMC [Candidatus Neomarinimicrobiota bacterium]HRS52427.1 chromosome segregation protein SMC [Candidatus Neomarinimicrobiota bacterium]HRU92516.1 chromosome segregation protein SMC [Candidatus Neomarinimicrobiota bacterium]
MYISKLTLYGFKSFLKKSEIQFGRGITSIVGPNGCGKTNIVDAIRWVIGEQKASVLRAERVTDVIFNGTATRRPLNLAEVSLTINNVSGRVPIAYSDVEITRRLYRNGESEYFINRNLCRLKDITDLFIDTGMGANAYSIIELKMIEDILSETPEERKRLFEEAAGVNKYRVQRKAALRKLESTRDDLLRLNDIINEVDQNVKNLKRQIARYEKYQETTQKLIEAEVILASRRIFDLRAKQAPILAEIDAKQKLLEKISAELSGKESQGREQQKILNAIEAELQSRRNELEALRANKAKLEASGLLLKEQLRNNAQNNARLTTAINALLENIESTKNRQKIIEQELITNAQTLEEKRLSYKSAVEAQQGIENNYKKLSADLQALQDERFNAFRQQAEQTARLNNLKENINQREKELQNIIEQIATQTNNQTNLATTLKELREKIDVLTVRRDELEKSLQNELSRQQSLNEQENHVRDELRHCESALDKLNNQIQFYSSIIHSKEGFAPGLQYVLDHPDEFPGIRGALSDLLSVDPRYYLAVEAVIKDIARLLVAESRPAALQTLEKLNRLEKGRVSIIPLDSRSRMPAFKPAENGLQPLLKFIKSDAHLENLKEMLFGNVYCCSDDQFEELINNPDLESYSIVTDRGRFRDANGWFSGGAEQSAANVLVGRQTRLNELEEEIKSVEKQRAVLLEKLQSAQSEIHRHNEIREKLHRDRQQIEAEIRQLSDVLRATESQQVQSSGTLTALNEQKVTLTTAIASFKERLAKETPAQSSVDSQLAQMDQLISIKKTELDQVRANLDQHNQNLQNLRVELINLENKARNLADEKVVLERNLNNNLEQVEKARQELAVVELEKGQLEKSLSDNKLAETEAVTLANQAESKYRQIEQAFKSLREKIEAINTEIFNLRHTKEQNSEDLKRLELANSQFTANINEISSVLLEKYNRTPLEEISTDLPAETEARQVVERYRHNLEQIGMVNMAVKEEYEQEYTRWKFLNDQRDDLVSSEKGLTEVIAQIDQIAREQYLETFNQIRSNFKTTFDIFFGGGEADLRLIGADDPLEAEIDIWACPSGKKMRSLRMLSAGEKALTAIALLFAIYQVKPSPFCILDEVDAPLDDENIRRFTNVIRTFSENTQFIIVTHNKATMAIADALYGVTMAEKGVSQIVSVKLE